MRRKHAHPPSRGGCRRLPKVVCLRLPPPSPYCQSNGSGSFGHKLKPSADDHRQPHHLAYDGAEPAIRQGLLHVGGNIFFPVTLHEDHPLRVQPHLRQRRKKQVRPRQAPDHRSLGSGRNPGCKQCGRGTIHRSRTATRKLVQSPVGQSATGKNGVDLRDPERKTARFLRALPFDGRDALAQISKDLSADSRHRSRIPSGSRWLK